MNRMQMMEILDAIAALEMAAVGVPIDHEIWALKNELRTLESAGKGK